MQANGMSKPTFRRWRDRFLLEGVDGLPYDIPSKTGRKPVSDNKAGEAIELAMSPPPEHCSHWMLRALAKKTGSSIAWSKR